MKYWTGVDHFSKDNFSFFPSWVRAVFTDQAVLIKTPCCKSGHIIKMSLQDWTKIKEQFNRGLE